jgi:hypothetical protein
MAIGKIYVQNASKMAIKYTNIFHRKTFQNLPKFELFCLKICHLATLISSATKNKAYLAPSWRGQLSKLFTSSSGANPTIASYNAGVVKIYNTLSSLVRFEGKDIFLYILLKTLQPTTAHRCRCNCKFRSRRTGSRFVQLRLPLLFEKYTFGQGDKMNL